MPSLTRALLLLSLASLLGACGGVKNLCEDFPDREGCPDAATDAATDAAVDAASDSALPDADAATDTGVDAGACGGGCRGATPVCDEASNTCVQCLAASDCGSGAPVCDDASHACVACLGDADCTDAAPPRCDTSAHECVACLGASDCDATAPVCDDAHTCAGCAAATDCAAYAATPACGASGGCVECTASDDAACAGATPACDDASNTCVECAADADCGGDAPRCEPSAHTCVACLAPADCTDPAAARCTPAHECRGCTMDAQCARLSATPVCDEPAATCVECAVDADCPGMACRANHSCSAYAPMAQTQCQPCDTDRDCQADHYCVQMTFAGAAHGSYCLKDASVAGCSQPYAIPITGRSSVDGHASPYCGINEMLTTCEAVRGLVNNRMCRSGNDADCPQGGLCRTVGFSANRCTYKCGVASDCVAAPSAGSSCGRAAMALTEPTYCGG